MHFLVIPEFEILLKLNCFESIINRIQLWFRTFCILTNTRVFSVFSVPDFLRIFQSFSFCFLSCPLWPCSAAMVFLQYCHYSTYTFEVKGEGFRCIDIHSKLVGLFVDLLFIETSSLRNSLIFGVFFSPRYLTELVWLLCSPMESNRVHL